MSANAQPSRLRKLAGVTVVAFNAVLVLTLLGQVGLIVLLNTREAIPLPARLLAAANPALAEANLEISAEAMQWRRDGDLLVDGLTARLHDASGAYHLTATADARLRLRRRPEADNALRAHAVELSAITVTAHEPGSDEPPETLLANGDLLLGRREKVWQLEQCYGELLGIPTSITGALPTSPPRESLPSATAEAPIPALEAKTFERARSAARAIIRAVNESCVTPFLCVDVQPNKSGLHLKVRGGVEAVERPAFTSGRIRASADLTTATMPALALDLHAQNVTYRHRPAEGTGVPLKLGFLALRLTSSERPTTQNRTTNAGLWLGDLQVDGEPLHHTHLTADITADIVSAVVQAINGHTPTANIAATVGATAPNSHLCAKFSADLAARTVSGTTRGRLNPALPKALNMLPTPGPEDTRYAINGPVMWNGDLRFTPSQTFPDFTGRIYAGSFSYGQLHVRHAYAGGQIVDGVISLPEVYLAAPDYSVRGTYWHELPTRRYRISASGSVHPPDLSPLIDEDWWDDLITRFTFDGPPPEADIFLRGRYQGEPSDRWMFLHASLHDATYEGVPMDRLQTRIWREPYVITLPDLHGTNKDGTLRTALRIVNDAQTLQRRYLSVRGASTLPLAQLGRLIGPDADPVIQRFSEVGPTTVTGSALILGPGSSRPGAQFVKLLGRFPEGVRVSGTDFERLSFRAVNDPETLDIEVLDARIGGGAFTGDATVTKAAKPTAKDHIEASFEVKSADLQRLLDALPDISEEPAITTEARKAASEATSGENAKNHGRQKMNEDGETDYRNARGRRASPNSAASDVEQARDTDTGVDLKNGWASGTIGELESFTGGGDLIYRDPDLARIDIMGELTRALDNFGIPFMAMRFEEARAMLAAERGYLRFRDLEVTGRFGRIDGNGYLHLSRGDLNFRARLNTFGGVDVPVVSFLLRNTVGRLTGAAGITLTGTLDDLNWTVSPDPAGIVRKPEILVLPPPDATESTPQ